jgi:hypothetical protein
VKRFLPLVLLLASSPARAAGSIPPERLRSDLEQGARLFRQNPDPASAAAYADALDYVDVTWNGDTITVRDPWLTDAVSGLDRLDPEARKKRLAAIADHLSERAALVERATAAGSSPSASPKPTPADPDRVLAGILDQQQFHAPVEDPKLAKAAAKVRERVRAGWTSFKDFLRGVFQNDDRPQSVWDRIKSIGILVLALLGTAILGWLVVRAILRASADSAAAERDEPLPEEPPKPLEMAKEAERLAEGGDLRGAIRARYLSLLGELHGAGLIVYDRRRTNLEYLKALAGREGNSARARAFADVVEVFDRKWYGRESCTREELGAFADAARRAGASTGQAEAA